MTDAAIIHAAAAQVETDFGHLDILVNNAGIALERASAGEANLDVMRQTYETNVFGVVAVTQSFLPLLRKSDAGRIVNLSSGLGSLVLNSDPTSPYAQVKPLAYNSSKAALNMVTVLFAADVADTPIKVNAADPGYTATDLNGNSGPQTVTEGTDAIVTLATEGPGHGSGRFVDRDGEIKWS